MAIDYNAKANEVINERLSTQFASGGQLRRNEPGNMEEGKFGLRVEPKYDFNNFIWNVFVDSEPLIETFPETEAGRADMVAFCGGLFSKTKEEIDDMKSLSREYWAAQK